MTDRDERLSGSIRAIREQARYRQAIDAIASGVRRRGLDIATRGQVTKKRAPERAEPIIDSIARTAVQANLLALNGAIEAVRAGETKRSFSAAAAKMQTLSSATSRATGDIVQQAAQVQSAARIAGAETNTVDAAARSLSDLALNIDAKISALLAKLRVA